MKTTVTTLSFAVVMCGCAIEPAVTTQPDGTQSYTINCSSGIDKCHQRSAKLCPTGYDIIEHTKKLSTLVPHYGEYPMTINIENLTISCKQLN